MNRWPRASVGILGGAAALILGLAVLSGGLVVAGYDPALALGAMVHGAFGSWYAFTSATLLRSVPLILLGLGFALAFRGGALNIGMEGQFLAGAIAATAVGLRVGALPAGVAIPLVWLSAVVAGALWIAFPVFLRWRFGVLEVISTLLLNFVAEALVSLMVQGPLQEAQRTYPQSDAIAHAARLPLLPGTRLHAGFLVVMVLAILGAVLFSRSVWGFQLRAVGAGPDAAWLSGRIPRERLIAVALLVSGAVAGLGGGIEVTGVTYALFQNLSPGYGFTAIAVALLARGRPVGIVVTGVLFGALESGASAMQREASIPAATVYVVEAVMIIVVLLADVAARTRMTRARYLDPREEAASP